MPVGTGPARALDYRRPTLPVAGARRGPSRTCDGGVAGARYIALMIRRQGCSEARIASVRGVTGLLALGLGLGLAGCARGDASAQLPPGRRPAAARMAAPLVVRVLDVGQGDAIYIENGGSRVLVDGGPDRAVMGRKLDALGLHDDTLDVVVLTHEHADHASGLRAVFEQRRHITVRYFFENEDPYTGYGLAELRDSASARAARGELVLRDTDDPCANGQPTCTINLRGGARLRILRPPPEGRGVPAGNPNNRSVALKLVAPDSAAFTMWLAGDAQRQELTWFDETGYARDPGMRVDVLKADHHGSCNGISGRYLDRTHPRYVVVSVGARNTFGHVHEQAKTLLRARKIPWYRTDRNGDIVIRVPVASPGTKARASFSITPTRGPASADGTSDRSSTQTTCRQP
jgi:competence protein ComEC